MCRGDLDGVQLRRQASLVPLPSWRVAGAVSPSSTAAVTSVAYHTQRVPPASRSLERAQRLRVRLGGSVDMTQPFPAKPKGMHFLTYMKWAVRAWRAEDEANGEVRKWVASVRQRRS